jgi:dephospho-CoA kinase
MLRVGLTGDLGSGKSTVAGMLAERGAVVLSSDEMGRAMMQPGGAVYNEIVSRFGPSVVAADQSLDRRKLAALAFDAAQPRVEELNAIVHPAVIRAQEQQIAWLAREQSHAIVVVESALIFSTQHATGQQTLSGSAASSGTGTSSGTGASSDSAPPLLSGLPWRSRFDCVLLVTAPESEKIARFVRRMAAGRILSPAEQSALEQDARRRLALQNSASHAAECMVIDNAQDMAHLEQQVDAAWHKLQRMEETAPFSAAAPKP